jgi:hypothetical protein
VLISPLLQAQILFTETGVNPHLAGSPKEESEALWLLFEGNLEPLSKGREERMLVIFVTTPR